MSKQINPIFKSLEKLITSRLRLEMKSIIFRNSLADKLLGIKPMNSVDKDKINILIDEMDDEQFMNMYVQILQPTNQAENNES